MHKKVLIIFLLLAFINFIAGCSSFHSVSVSEYKQVEEEEGKPIEIYVKTKTKQWYHFTNSNFYIENDTLYGKISVKELPFEGKFAFGEIKSIQIGSDFYAVSQYQKIEAESGKPYVIYLTKNDRTIYQFMKNDYYIENDTLYGKGKLILNEEELLDRNIALSHIESIEVENFNLAHTITMGLGIFAIAFFIFFIIWVSSLGDSGIFGTWSWKLWD